jgi:hypothetical protein
MRLSGQYAASGRMDTAPAAYALLVLLGLTQNRPSVLVSVLPYKSTAFDATPSWNNFA